ncbi:MIP18 family protein galla-2 [Phymastichus coffea]|uniref:MIP18 family protein galla-2 n=1 Tax=Phymastichus coffea TaxID=108790 RepID=UPI00273B39AA|nr:MIP18 family protein galla-2 [Phymastichus coffea]
MNKVLENPNPKIYPKLEDKLGHDEQNLTLKPGEYDARGIFELLRHINDPEHPLTLEQLNVVEQSLIEVDNKNNEINVKFTPTIPHCSMATLIGLSIRTQLLRKIPPKFKVSVMITPGTHIAENAVNKQLADKERVAAALENQFLLTVIEQCLDTNLIQNNLNEEDDIDENESTCCGNASSTNESSCCRSTVKEKEKPLTENVQSTCCQNENKDSVNVSSKCCQNEDKSTTVNDSSCCQNEKENNINVLSCCQSEKENITCCQNST